MCTTKLNVCNKCDSTGISIEMWKLGLETCEQCGGIGYLMGDKQMTLTDYKEITSDPKCKECNRRPEEIAEYRMEAKHEGITPKRWVLENERFIQGTLHKFYCTECYIKIGMPLF